MNSTSNITSTDFPLLGVNLNSDILQQSRGTYALVSFLAAACTFLGYLSYTPKVDKRAPPLTSDRTPFIGSWSYFTKRWSFWKNSVDESKTGHFSFWLGKNHCVGVSGEAARKWFLDNRHFHRINGAILHGVGPEITPPIHQVFQMTYDKGHSFFQRRVLDFMKADHLARGLPYVIGDACAVFGALAKDPSGVIDPIDACYRLVLKQTARIVLADEVSDDPKKLDTYLYYTKILQHTHSGHTCAVPWLPSYEHWKRLYCRRGLKNLFTPVVSKRMEEGAPRGKDGLQVFLDNKDPVDWIITVFIAISFISVGNAGKLSGGLLNLMANHPDWQEKIYAEIKATAQAHSANKDAPLVQQLDSLPFEAWESISPLIDLCVAESIRMHVAFPMTRQNIAPTALTIPGTNQVVPSGSFIVYNTGDAHFNEKLYPNHMKMDPNRFGEGHGEFKKESYGFLGWGNGRHRCVGQRWARLQQNIILAYALANSKWVACDENGQPVHLTDRKINFDTHGTSLPKGIYLKHIPRDKA